VQGSTLMSCCQWIAKLHGCSLLPCGGDRGAQTVSLGFPHWFLTPPAPCLVNASPTWAYASGMGCSGYGCCACNGRWAEAYVVAFLHWRGGPPARLQRGCYCYCYIFRTQPHLGCCLAAAPAASPAIFVHGLSRPSGSVLTLSLSCIDT
jgi:hypothetical protein